MQQSDNLPNEVRYRFTEVSGCEMCGDSTAQHAVLGQRLNQSQGWRPRQKAGIAVTVKQCSRCQLIYADPQPVPLDFQDHYGRPPKSYWQPHYFQ